jgi:DNA-binding response OmpR family regulator
VNVLVVEDEPALATALVRALGTAGFAAVTALDGLTGLHLAREGGYDAIVLDVMLPGLNGFALCERLRAEGIRTPVLVLTARDDELDEAEALDLGADDFLRKPFSPVVLVARLHALLRRSAAGRPAVLRAGSLALDPGRRRATWDSDELPLTPRELSLLEYLMRAEGQVVSKADLLTHVWGSDFDRDPNVVQVYVGYLRRKIDERVGREVVETVRGHGYRLALAPEAPGA